MIGETVEVLHPVVKGRDELGEPEYEWIVEHRAPDVLVSPGGTEDLTDALRVHGDRVVYSLQFPKTFTGSLRNRRIKVRGETFSVIGDPKPYQGGNTPTRWHMPVQVEQVKG